MSKISFFIFLCIFTSSCLEFEFEVPGKKYHCYSDSLGIIKF